MADIKRKVSFVKGDDSALDMLQRGQLLLDKNADAFDRLRREALAESASTVRAQAQVSTALQRRQQAQRLSATQASAGIGSGGAAIGSALNAVGLGDIGQLTQVAGQIGNAAKELPKLGSSLGALLTSMGPLGIAAGVATVAIGALSAAYNQQKAAADAATQSIVQASRAQFDAQKLVEEGNLAALEARRTALIDAQRIEQAAVDAIKARLAEIDNTNVGFSILGQTIASTNPELESLNAELTKAEARADAAKGALDAFNSSIEKAGEATLQLNTAVSEYIANVDKATAAQNAAAAAYEQAQINEERLTGAYVDGQQSRLEAFVKRNEREDAAIATREADRRADLDRTLAQQAADHAAQMVSISAASAERIADLQQSVADAERDYQDNEVKALKAFRAEQRRINEQANRDETKAVRDNNILAVFDIRENAKAAKKENKERFNEEKALRAEELEAYKANVAQRIAEEQRLAAAALASAQQEYEQRLALDAETRRITAEREQRDRETRRAQELADFDAIEALETQRYRYQVAQLNALILLEKQRYDAAHRGLLETYKGAPVQIGSGALPLPQAPSNVIPGVFGPQSTSGAQSASPSVTFAPGSIIVGDIASKADVMSAIREGVIPAIIQARQGRAS